MYKQGGSTAAAAVQQPDDEQQAGLPTQFFFSRLFMFGRGNGRKTVWYTLNVHIMCGVCICACVRRVCGTTHIYIQTHTHTYTWVEQPNGTHEEGGFGFDL